MSSVLRALETSRSVMRRIDLKGRVLKPSPSHARTLEEIAVRVGVSRMTVSRALRGSVHVSPATRKRIEEAARALNYVPNLLASSLSGAPTGMVGVVVPRLSDETFSATLAGMTTAADRAGVHLMILESRYSQQVSFEQARALIGRQVDGIVLFAGDHGADTAELIKACGIAVVETWGLPKRPLGAVAGVSNRDVGQLGASHLLARGCRRLAFAGAAAGRDNERWQGFRAVCPSAARLFLGQDGGSYYNGYAEGARLAARLKTEGDVDGLMVADDTAAIALVTALRQHGISMRGDISVLGVGNLPQGEYCMPRLSSIDLQAEPMGRAAVELLVSSGNEAPQTIRFEPSIIERET